MLPTPVSSLQHFENTIHTKKQIIGHQTNVELQNFKTNILIGLQMQMNQNLFMKNLIYMPTQQLQQQAYDMQKNLFFMMLQKNLKYFFII